MNNVAEASKPTETKVEKRAAHLTFNGEEVLSFPNYLRPSFFRRAYLPVEVRFKENASLESLCKLSNLIGQSAVAIVDPDSCKRFREILACPDQVGAWSKHKDSRTFQVHFAEDVFSEGAEEVFKGILPDLAQIYVLT